MLMSEEDGRLGFSYANLSHPSGFKISESRSTNNVLHPSPESLPKNGNNISTVDEKALIQIHKQTIEIGRQKDYKFWQQKHQSNFFQKYFSIGGNQHTL